jgi:hypothetical protein
VANDIRQRIILEGEKEYRQALQNANRNLKTLRSELKAETAELGNNATAQQKNQVKTKNLQKQIQEQEKVVRAYRDALEEVRAKYGDNEDAIARYQQKLNDARATLANMKNSLNDVGRSYETINAGAKNGVLENNALAESFGRISDAADSMAKTMESVFGKTISAIRSAISSVWGELMDVAQKSDNWTDLAAYLGATTVEVQKWDRAMQDIGGDFSTITGMISKLKYGGKADKVSEWFGISAENYTNDLEYVQAVMQAMVDSKEEMVNAGTWDDAMSDIFGAKKVQEIDSVMSDWNTLLDRLEHWDVSSGGLGLTEDEISSMNELAQKVRDLKGDWKYLKEHWAVTLAGDLALKLTSNAQGALDALMEFMDADTQEERDAAIQKFQENIEEAFTALGEAIAAAGEALEEAGKKMQGSENGWVSLLGSVLEKLGEAMKWIADPDNLDKVKTFFEVLVAIWAAGKMATAVTHLMGIANAFKTLHSNKAVVSALSNLGAGGTGTGLGTGGALGTQSITTQTVATANVTTMTVGTMIGGQGGAPVTQAVNPTTTVNTTVASTPVLLGGGSAVVGLTAGSGNTAQAVLQSGSGQLHLEGDVDMSGANVSYAGEFANPIQAEGSVGEATPVTAFDKIGFGGFQGMGKWGSASQAIANAMTNPTVVAMTAAMMLSPLAGKLSQMHQTEQALEDYYGDDYTELTASQKRNVKEFGDTPDEAKARDEVQKSGSWGWVSEIGDEVETAISENVVEPAKDIAEGAKAGWNYAWAALNNTLFGDDNNKRDLEKAEEALTEFLADVAYDAHAEEKQREEEAKARAAARTAADKERNAEFAAGLDTGFTTPDWYKEGMTATERMDLVDDIISYPGKYTTGDERIDFLLKSRDRKMVDQALDMIRNGGLTENEVHQEMNDWWNGTRDDAPTSGALRMPDSSWWRDNSTPGDDGQQMRNIMAGLPKSFADTLSGVKVVMDGESVGYIVAPIVSQQIARNTA